MGLGSAIPKASSSCDLQLLLPWGGWGGSFLFFPVSVGLWVIIENVGGRDLSIPAYFIPAHVGGQLVKDPGLLLLFRGLGPYRLHWGS